MNNTEELVRKCFCHCAVFKEGYESKQLHITASFNDVARAARRFVKLENIHKTKERHEKFLRWCRKNPTVDEKGVKLPKHWGQLKVNGRWL